MFRQLDFYTHDVPSLGGAMFARPVVAPAGRRVPRGTVADAEVPLFALVRTTLGLPAEDRRWWPEEMLPAVHLARPTIDLLERTLAGLRATETRTCTPRGVGRHARR
jgi:hypothetical protein